jgi:hypothetical protein
MKLMTLGCPVILFMALLDEKMSTTIIKKGKESQRTIFQGEFAFGTLQRTYPCNPKKARKAIFSKGNSISQEKKRVSIS